MLMVQRPMKAYRLLLNIFEHSAGKRPTIWTTTKRSYRYWWTNHRRLQNPELVKDIPTYEYEREDGKMKRRSFIYACGLGATGSLGMSKYYLPEKKNLEDLRHKNVGLSTFRRIGVFKISDSIKDVACGYGFTIVVANVKGSDYTVLGCGLNSYSQIGCHESRPGFPLEVVATFSPIFMPTNSPVAKVACGRSHSIFLDQAGQVFSMGNNSLGQCGRPIEDGENYFGSKRVHKIEIPDLRNPVVDIECGQDHSFFLSTDGKLYSCGWGADGQTGLGHYENQQEVALVKGDIEGVKVTKVSSYADTVLALDTDGNLFGWGNTEYAQFRTLLNSESEQFNTPRHLKLKNIPGKIVDVAAGGTICAILNDAGQVYVWGFGILGKGPKVDQSSKPILIPESLLGTSVYHRDVKVTKIYASLSHFAAITNVGDLYMWGRNRGQCLGFPHSRDQFFPMRVNMDMAVVKKVALGVDHTCAIVEKVC